MHHDSLPSKNKLYQIFQTLAAIQSRSLCSARCREGSLSRLGGSGELVAVGIEVVILVLAVGLSWTTDFVLFSLRIAVFHGVFVLGCGLGLRMGCLVGPFVDLSRHQINDFQ